MIPSNIKTKLYLISKKTGKKPGYHIVKALKY